jgi:hypothetical protein
VCPAGRIHQKWGMGKWEKSPSSTGLKEKKSLDINMKVMYYKNISVSRDFFSHKSR